MNEEFKEIPLENLISLSFEEAFNYANQFIDSLPITCSNSQDYKNKQKYLDDLINLVEGKVLDDFISISEREKIIQNHLTQEEESINYNPKKVETEKIIKQLKKYYTQLKKAEQVFKKSINDNNLLKIYGILEKIPKEIVNLDIYANDIDESTKSLFYVEVIEEIIYQDDKFLAQMFGHYFTKKQKVIKLNPNYQTEKRLNQLYLRFVKEVPKIIQNSIKKIKRNISNLETIVNEIISERLPLSDEKVIQITQRVKKIIEREMTFESKGAITKRYELIVKILRAKKRNLFGNEIYLPFEIFPESEWNRDLIIKKLKQNGIPISESGIKRIEKIREMFKPDRHAIGLKSSKGYEGYYVFIFDNVNKIIAENPLKDNATYLIKGSWEEVLEILKLSKLQVINHNKARRVIHRNEKQWISDLRFKFFTWY